MTEIRNDKKIKGEAIVKLQKGGRIVIPKTLLQKKKIEEGDYVAISVIKVRMVLEENEAL